MIGTPDPNVAQRHRGGAAHFFTSGTEGVPRGVVRTWESLQREAIVVGTHLGMRPGVRVLCAVSPVHGYGFTGGVFAPLAAGATSVLAIPGRASSLAAALRKYEPEIVYAVPAQYAAWSRRVPAYDGPRPRLWISSGAPLPDPVRHGFESAWGAVIAEQHGMTECGAVSIDLEASGTLGRPYPGVVVRLDGGPPGAVVVDTTYGPCCWAGPGRGDHSSPFAPGGFCSGDIGTWDEAGRLRLVGRRAGWINVRGRKVDPAAVEQALWRVPDVRDIAVLGVDRPTGDQWVAAFVARFAPASTSQLADALRGLDEHERPQRVISLPELPKTPTRKTDVAALRELLAGGRDGKGISDYSSGPT
jgi:acyl-coenzyme A synthetase/AMP-(fatty) acid ligase